MKNIIFTLLAIFILTTGCKAQNNVDKVNQLNLSDSTTVLQPLDKHFLINNFARQLLTKHHYKKTEFNDSLSSVTFDNYFKSLDNNKMYFLKSEISSFEKYRYELDNNFNMNNLDFAYEAFNLFKQRVKDRTEYVKNLLKGEFDFTVDESFIFNRKDEDWADTFEGLNEIWRKRVKNDALNLKLTGKEWTAIQENLIKRYNSFAKAIYQYNSEDVFQLYINSFTSTIDPHTDYLSPVTSENFKIDMSRALEGIGAQLQTDNEYTKVVNIIKGGPADKSNLLLRDDRIIGVAQDDTSEFVDVIGWRINDVVQLIRGPKDSIVRLQILRAKDGANALPTEIRLIRDKVKLEDQFAKKETIEIENEGIKYKIGIISVPSFYKDFDAQRKGEKDFNSTQKDVRKLLKELQQESVDGILVDLRNNGGGSLEEAIELTGLFIKDGPIVQVRNANGSIDPGDDPDTSMIYDGPLGVLVNKFSASASEIFAAAIQDYKRGVIIGDNTFGKGTVQNLIDLNRFIKKDNDDFGQFKITLAKFYRISGESTQRNGVTPDIKIPSPYSSEEFGEIAQKSALPSDKIPPAKYETYSSISSFFSELEKKHEGRIKNDKKFEELVSDINKFNESRNKIDVSLNEKIRKKEREKEFDEKSSDDLEIQEIEEVSTNDETDVKEDFTLFESTKILADLIYLISKQPSAYNFRLN